MLDMQPATFTKALKHIKLVIVTACSVTVSVTTIKGTECRLLELGRVAEITGGQV